MTTQNGGMLHFIRKVFRIGKYKISRSLEKAWKSLDCTVEEGIKELSSICSVEVDMKNVKIQSVPQPRPFGKELLKSINLTLPDAVSSRGVQVDTRKKLIRHD